MFIILTFLQESPECSIVQIVHLSSCFWEVAQSFRNTEIIFFGQKKNYYQSLYYTDFLFNQILKEWKKIHYNECLANIHMNRS